MRITKKLLCKESFYYNLTSPYFYFNKGEWYEFIINVHDETKINVYSCTYCDFLTSEDQILRFFQPLEDWREEQLNKIFNI